MTDQTNRKQLRGFYFKLIIPGMLTITAFIVSIYFIFIPSLESNMINQKKQMIKALTQSAWSILMDYHEKEAEGLLTREEAKEKSISLLKVLRYGPEGKDYFWVTDMTPVMVAHPYRPDLNGSNLENYEDPNGKKLFVESALVVKSKGEGFVDYFWQWKDDSTQIVPKLSFVKGFDPWQWVIGTGIYVNDIEQEISRLERRLILISLLIIVFVSLSLIYILRTGLLLEAKRQRAVFELEESRERYRSLVEASKEGTILTLDGNITYANPYFLEIFNYSPEDLIGKDPEILFDSNESEVVKTFRNFMRQDQGVIQLETSWKGNRGIRKNVLVTISRMKIGTKKAGILISRELSASHRMAKQIGELGEELQTSLLFMNQPVHSVARSPLVCFMNTTIKSCAETMSKADQDGILVSGPKGEFLGIVTDFGLRQRVLARGIDYNTPVFNVMSSPIVSIADNALLFEALVSLQQNNVTHIAIKDPSGIICGLISHENLLQVQQNTTAFLMREIDMAEHADDLIQYSRKTRGIVKVLEQSGAKTCNITRIITAVTDALSRRFIELAVKEAGPPSAEFVFIAFGSEGRGEQTLATDQDNGIIYRGNNDNEELQNYFLNLGKKVNDWLNQAGYNLCSGEVMAGNPKWCKPLTQWENSFKDWIVNAEPKAVLEASIFFDFRPISGDYSISDELQSFVDKTVKHQMPFIYQMANQTLKFKSSSGLAAHYKTNTTSGIKVFDCKRILFPIISFCRLYAINHQIKTRSTPGRLNSLNQSGIISDDIYRSLSEDYDFLMMLRFKTQLLAIDKNQEINNEVPVNMLNDMQKIYLKKILATISEIQTKLKQDFNII